MRDGWIWIRRYSFLLCLPPFLSLSFLSSPLSGPPYVWLRKNALLFLPPALRLRRRRLNKGLERYFQHGYMGLRDRYNDCKSIQGLEQGCALLPFFPPFLFCSSILPRLGNLLMVSSFYSVLSPILYSLPFSPFPSQARNAGSNATCTSARRSPFSLHTLSRRFGMASIRGGEGKDCGRDEGREGRGMKERRREKGDRCFGLIELKGVFQGSEGRGC